MADICFMYGNLDCVLRAPRRPLTDIERAELEQIEQSINYTMTIRRVLQGRIEEGQQAMGRRKAELEKLNAKKAKLLSLI